MTTPAAVPSIFDTTNLAALKGGVRRDDPQAVKAAAQQFEALFMQMVMKSMRDATPREGLFDSEQTRMYESLLDQQMAQVMSTKSGTGLAALIEKQLLRTSETPVEFPEGLPLAPAPKGLPLNEGRPLPLRGVETSPRFLPLDGVRAVPVPPAGAATGASSPVLEAPPATGDLPPAAREFISRVWPHAVEASRATGIPAQFMVAQAALETGWGRSEPRLGDGSPSHNLFGIKAGRSWNGAVAVSQTTEYVDGAAQRQTERFRAYGSYAEAFRDYAELLTSSPRYAGVVGSRDAGSFAHGLQRAGYATDPAYAEKVTRIIGSLSPKAAAAA